MAVYSGSKLNLVLIIGLLVTAAIYLLLMISGAGILPGDTGTDPTASATEVNPTGQPMDLAALPWASVVLVFTAILGAGLAYAQYRSSKVTPREEMRTEAATHEKMKKEEL
jgi:hypothetical protein